MMKCVDTPFGNICTQPAIGARPFPLYQEDESTGTAPQYQAILDYATLQGFALPSAEQQVFQKKLVEELVAQGIWDKLDVFYNFFTDAFSAGSGFAKINWKAPGTFNADGTGHEPAFTINSGFKGNGTTSYLNTGWIPSGGVQFALNDCSLILDVSQVIQEVKFHGSSSATEQTCIATLQTATQLSPRLNSAPSGPLITYTLATDNFLHVQRKISSQVVLHQNGVQAGIATLASLARAALSFYLGALNSSGVAANFSTNNIRCFGAGASLTGHELDFYTMWSQYKASVISNAAYKAIIDYATSQTFTLPSASQQEAQKLLIYRLLLDGIWDKLDVFYNFFTDGDNNFAKINWKAPGTFQLVQVGAAYTFVPNDGFEFPGVGTRYLETNWIPSVNGVNYTLNGGGFGTNITTDDAGGNADAGCQNSSTTQLVMYTRLANSQSFWNINSGDVLWSSAARSSRGVYHGGRTASNVIKCFFNGVLQLTSAVVSNAMPTVSFRIGTVNGNAGLFPVAGRRMAMFYIGSSLVNLEPNLYNNWEEYKAGAVVTLLNRFRIALGIN